MKNVLSKTIEEARLFWERLRQFHWQKPVLWLVALGWLISFFLAFSPDVTIISDTLAGIVHLFLWIQLLRLLRKELNPSTEILWGVIIALWVAEYLLYIGLLPDPMGQTSLATGFFENTLQVLMLALLELALGLLIFQNNGGRAGVLVGLFFLRLPMESILESESVFLLYVFLAITVIILLPRTTWANTLSQAECWIFMGVFILLLNLVYQLNPFAGMVERTWIDRQIWFSTPQFTFILILTYLVAFIIKFPTVLIFNYASLARKLRISGLFQSTIPLLIQLASLLFIFYSFIATWQAQTLRERLTAHLETISQKSDVEDVRIYPYEEGTARIKWPGYAALEARQLPQKGLLQMQQTGAANNGEGSGLFLFMRSDTSDSAQVISVTPVDTTLMRKVLVHGQRYLGGSSLLFYPVRDDQWIWRAPQFRIWQFDNDMQIYPIGLINYRRVTPMHIAMESDSSFVDTNITLGLLGDWRVTFGRLFIPIWEADNNNNFAVFDIVLDIQSNFRWSDLLTVVSMAILVYLLLNLFLIQRMTSFGMQINKIIVKKFQQLRKGIQEISEGNLDYQLAFEGDDEFSELGERFNRMGSRLAETIAAQREKDRMQYELQAARNVQLSLLPQLLPIIPGYQISATLHTATEVGGDFYDVFPLETDKDGTVRRVLFTVGDVSGKGSSAALYMAQCMSLIRYSVQFTEDVQQVCVRLNSYFANQVEDRQIFVTLIIGILDTHSHTVSWVRAGHTEPALLPGDFDDPPRLIKSKGMGIGLTKHDSIVTKAMEKVELVIHHGDALVIYTDGVIEASYQDGDGEEAESIDYDEATLLERLKQLRKGSANDIQEAIDRDLEKFYGKHARIDDHTILVIRRDA